ncbi:uncharacterized protein [Palaemon carinicauda]|uniref:uncharacterized protein isoform X1 n=1 Tax=Palaemon carinicauda TaxID=392227 RepID=UPI0035B5CDD0
MANVCNKCEYTRDEAIRLFLSNNEETLKFLRNHGVLPSEIKCPRCSNRCTLRSDRHCWQCHGKHRKPKSKKRIQCTFSISDYKGTFLDNCHSEPWKLILFANLWLQKSFSHTSIMQNLNLASETSVRWRMLCSEVAEYFVDIQPPIGGTDIIVEVDECKLGYYKNDSGSDDNGVSVFGGIERVSKRFFAVPLIDNPSRGANTLIPLIKKHISPGSILVTDTWPAYKTISEYGYQHLIVNARTASVGPENPKIHIQNIKWLWKDIKSYVPKSGTRKVYYNQYVSRYVFIKSVPNYKELLHQFFITAAELYPPYGQTTQPDHDPVEIKPDQDPVIASCKLNLALEG